MQDTPANGKGSKTAVAADKEETAHEEGSESLVEGTEKDDDGKDEEIKGTEKTVAEDETLGENGSIDNEDKKEELTNVVSDSLAAPDDKPEEADLETDMRETSAVENVMETTDENKDVGETKEEYDETPAGEETNSSDSIGKATSAETAMSELPKVKYPGNVCGARMFSCVAKIRNLLHIN